MSGEEEGVNPRVSASTSTIQSTTVVSSSSTSLADQLPSSVPKLDPSGLNWAIFSVRFQDAVEAKGFWGHFDGSEPRPVAATPSAPNEADQTKINQWLKHERSAKSLLTQKLPDSTLMRVHSKPTVMDRWNAIVVEYTKKGTYAQTEMRAKFLAMRCPDKGNPRDFLDSLRVKREELATMGVEIDKKDYLSTIISSLPVWLSNFASNQLAAARLYATDKTIDPDELISMIAEESDRQRTLRAARPRPPKKEGGNDVKDEALAASSSGGKRKAKPKGACWNCGEVGHLKSKCPKPKKENSQASSSGTANVAESESEDEGAFFMEPDSDDDSIVILSSCESGESSLEIADSGSDAESGWGTEELSGIDCESDSGSLVDVDMDSDMAAEAEELVARADETGENKGHTEIVDSGCSRHLTPFRSDLSNYVEIEPKAFRAANKREMKAVGMGTMTVSVPNGDGVSKLKLNEVLYSPDVGYTLLSVGRLDKAGYTVTFGSGKCAIRGPSGNDIGAIPMTNQCLYKLRHDVSVETATAAVEVLTLNEAHRRLGHISLDAVRSLINGGLVTGIQLKKREAGENSFCLDCLQGKATREEIPKVRKGPGGKKFGDEIHSDVWGPARTESKGGKLYYVTFTDDVTRFTHLYLLRAKSDVFDAYQKYAAWCETQLGTRIKVLHSDRGGEYLASKFIDFLEKRGTRQKLTVHDTPQQNGVAERRNRTILEGIRAILNESSLPKNMWGEAARHIIWLMNRTQTKAVDGKTPYEAVFDKKPDLRGLRIWGERIWVRLEDPGDKLEGRVKEAQWLGLDEQSKGVRVYWPDKQTVTVERNVYYEPSTARNEGENDAPVPIPTVETRTVSKLRGPPAEKAVKTDAETINPNVDANDDLAVPPVPETAPEPEAEPEREKRPQRTRAPSQRIRDIIAGKAVTSLRPSAPQVPRGVQLPPPIPEEVEEPPPAGDVSFEGEGQAEFIMTAENLDGYALAAEMSDAEGLEPRTLTEAKRREDWPLWETAIKDELAVLEKNDTWVLTELPPNANVVGSKWVFRAKKNAGGEIIRYKARLVAQGFSQVPGVDYFDTFAPVARLASIRTVLAMAADLDLELHQIDIKGAYLNGELTSRERIYMRQPPGYAAPDSPNLVCQLKKTLYGLKQSGRRWYQKLCEIMSSIGFKRCDVDMAVFYKHGKDKELTIVLVHVDDCTIAATSTRLIAEFKAGVAKQVEITDLGELHWLLGIEIRRDRSRRTLAISQRSYLASILRRYGFEDLKPVSIPMDVNTRLTTAQSPSTPAEYAEMRDKPYHEAVGSAMYATIGTRPDTAYPNQTVSRFSSNPGVAHWNAVKKLYQYYKGTIDLWLTYGGGNQPLVGYSDADGNMAKDRHAISGYAFLINGGAVSWSSKRQEIISLSTTESEYIAATHAAKEALWLRSLITQLFKLDLAPTVLFCDNQSAIELTKDHQYHARTKHIDIRYHFIRWIVEQGSLKITYCPTDKMIADALTKALPSAKVKHFAARLGLLPA